MSNNENISIKNINNILTPLSIYIILCFICVIAIFLYKSISLFLMALICMYITVTISSLIILGSINYAMEWSCTIILSLALFLHTYTILNPDVFLYQDIS